MAIFRSKAADDIDKIVGRLRIARDDLAAAERELHERSVEIVLTDDAATLAALNARVAAARDHLALVELAHRQAVQRETDRLAAARLRARRSEFRAFSQHLSALQRAVEGYQRTAAELQAAWETIIDAAERARRLLPTDGYRVYPELFEPALVRLGETELARLGRRGASLGLLGVSAPGASAAPLSGKVPAELPAMSQTMAKNVSFYSARFRDHLALPDTAEAVADPEPTPEPVPELVDPDAAEPAELAVAAVAISAPICAVAASEPITTDPHPPGSPGAAEYAAAMVEMRADRPAVEA